MPFVLKNTAQVSREEIAELERRIGMSLPEDYKSFLAETNGGQCYSGGVFREAATREKISRINIVLGLRDDSDYSIEHALSDMEGRMPEQLLPIAYDSGATSCCWIRPKGGGGTIYFLSLENAGSGRPAAAGLACRRGFLFHGVARAGGGEWLSA